jgi:hypothetical protein
MSALLRPGVQQSPGCGMGFYKRYPFYFEIDGGRGMAASGVTRKMLRGVESVDARCTSTEESEQHRIQEQLSHLPELLSRMENQQSHSCRENWLRAIPSF